jgi:hypothetical protein
MNRKAFQTLTWSMWLALPLGFAYAGTSSVVQHSLNGQRMGINLWSILVPVAVIALTALTAIFLGTKRGESLATATVIAEESHGSRVWSLVFVALLVAQLLAVITIPAPPVRTASALLGLLFAVIAIHIWAGFQYVFTNAGVEISTLGFRLRSIPREEIKQYAVESWNPLRGYGIRGIGNRRAYVWCNHGVRIQTTDGEVFLGHNDPDRIVRDLDAITLNQPSPVP